MAVATNITPQQSVRDIVSSRALRTVFVLLAMWTVLGSPPPVAGSTYPPRRNIR